MTYEVIIPAAGQGSRMKAGKNKLFIKLNEIPIIVHTLRIFADDKRCKKIILVIKKSEEHYFKQIIEQYDINKEITFAEGGHERQQSVANGLQVCNKAGIVLIHDGARPFVTYDQITKLLNTTIESGAAVLAVPVKDTIKRADNYIVKETIERSSLWSIQTPQAFRIDIVQSAHEKAEKAGYTSTDDAGLVEFIGHDVTIVEGNYDNIKLTTPEDIFFAEAILKKGEN